MNDILFGNNNRNVVGRIAKRSLAGSKQRNFFIVLTISLSISLILAISLYFAAQMKVKSDVLDHSQHVIYHNLSEEQIAALQNDSHVTDMMLVKWGPALEVDDYLLWSVYFGQPSQGIIEGTGLSEGAFPTAYNEVVVDSAYMERLGLDPQLGTEFTVTFLDGSTDTFKVSGFIDEDDPGNVFYLLHSKEYADKGPQLEDVNYNAPVRIMFANDMSAPIFMNFIVGLGAKYGIPQRDVNDNGAFTEMLEGDPATMTAIIGIGLLLLLVSVLVVYSVFYLSVTSRIQQFGQLRTIGMTEKQIRKMVTREGMILWAMAAPIGVLVGGIAGYALNPAGWAWGTALSLALAVLLAAAITVLISVHRPAAFAARVSPIESLRYNDSGQSNDTRQLSRRLAPFSLAVMSFRRNRKKTAMTLLSLCMGGILLMVSATFLVSHDREAYSRKKEFAYGEFAITYSFNPLQTAEHGIADFQANNPMGGDFTGQLSAVPGVTGVRVFEGTDVRYEYKGVTEPNSAAPINKEYYAEIASLFEDTPDYDEMLKGNQLLIVGNGNTQSLFGWKFEPGDIVPVNFWDGEEMRTIEFIIAACADRTPANNMNDGWFLIPEETMRRLLPDLDLTKTVVVQGDYQDEALQEEIRAIVNESPLLAMTTLQDRINMDASFFDGMYRTMLGLCFFIIAFSIINLLNTLVSSIVSRRKEFAMLQSIGMGDRQLSRMIQYEGLLIAVVNLLGTLVGGGLLGYFIVSLIRRIASGYLVYAFPILPFTGYALLILIVPIVISASVIRSMKRQTLVERLRTTE